MRYMLDTNIASYLVNNRHSAKLAARMQQVDPNRLFISTLTQGELLYGAAKINSQRLNQRLEVFLDTINICDWNSQAAIEYGTLRMQTTSIGITVAAIDLLIAAQAKAINMTLVSNDKIFNALTAHGLILENWY